RCDLIGLTGHILISYCSIPTPDQAEVGANPFSRRIAKRRATLPQSVALFSYPIREGWKRDCGQTLQSGWLAG
ncbi:MAG: hypothetical protein JAZ20_01160, partial [Candidatus Thiodiazotropha weberae]|nr:hypothetical protein [Candidatus Thiodiazotropha lotti]